MHVGSLSVLPRSLFTKTHPLSLHLSRFSRDPYSSIRQKTQRSRSSNSTHPQEEKQEREAMRSPDVSKRKKKEERRKKKERSQGKLLG